LFSSKSSILHGPVGATILKLAVPTVGGLVSITVSSLVQAFFLGRLGVTALAAVGIALPLQMIFSSIAGGLATGVGTLVAYTYGENKSGTLRKRNSELLTNDGLLLVLIANVLLLVLAFFGSSSLLNVMSSDQ
jgi:Na+-driven multidrug efflux pump